MQNESIARRKYPHFPTQFYLFAFQLAVKESKNAAEIMTPKDSKFSEV